LEYRYTHWIVDAINGSNPGAGPLDAVFVGGGAFTLPRWLEATRPGSRSLVLEVDGDMVDFVEDDLGVRASSAMRVAVGDGRIEMLDVETDSVDVVVGDAFSGLTVPWHLTTTEWMEEVQRVLRPGGLYAANIIDLPPLDFLKAETATMLDSFEEVRMITYADEFGAPAGGNIVLIASDRPLSERAGSVAMGATTFAGPEVDSFAADGKILTDSYAPVDQLLTVP
ncbi:MAG TPA: fused MFS/spermidine synthase, partial [Solirubrobacterales bacterium]|nr:fused MFS/spermidine synthase [Solirubrobacterales bacterium]